MAITNSADLASCMRNRVCMIKVPNRQVRAINDSLQMSLHAWALGQIQPEVARNPKPCATTTKMRRRFQDGSTVSWCRPNRSSGA